MLYLVHRGGAGCQRNRPHGHLNLGSRVLASLRDSTSLRTETPCHYYGRQQSMGPTRGLPGRCGTSGGRWSRPRNCVRLRIPRHSLPNLICFFQWKLGQTPDRGAGLAGAVIALSAQWSEQADIRRCAVAGDWPSVVWCSTTTFCLFGFKII